MTVESLLSSECYALVIPICCGGIAQSGVNIKLSGREFGVFSFNPELSLMHSLFSQICLRLEPGRGSPGQDHFIFSSQRSMVERGKSQTSSKNVDSFRRI